MTEIIFAGVSHKTADLCLREKAYLTERAMLSAYERIKTEPGVSGAFIISTCNRTELYLSAEADKTKGVAELFGEIAGLENDLCGVVSVNTEPDALVHLFRVAVGLESKIFFEDQILGQVKAAFELALSADSMDNILKKAVQIAVSCAKKIKSENSDGRRGDGIAGAAAKAVAVFADERHITALIIGGGAVGVRLAKLLVEQEQRVFITRRSREQSFPEGAVAVDYAERYAVLNAADAVVGATKSPHITLQAELAAAASLKPRLYLDLALPRDFDPKLATLPFAVLKNLEDIEASGYDASIEAKAEEAIREYLRDYKRWRSYGK
ncbi:MAG: hypothetical protein LBT55_04350 [Clostridiaceae bacterium]|jgi:glutamyl-tRNA reductase|nr:hypothetical protein [Clostridiaceae bacterium]